MAKEKTLFACTACGYETSRWVGRCPGCGAWNTMVESAPIVTGAPAKAPKQRPGTGASAMLLREIPEDVAVRSSTGISELDRVLGGGIVEGALMLIGGDPGIGKSTLLLQVCANLCKTGKRVLYVSGEESAKQLKLRANRSASRRRRFMCWRKTRWTMWKKNCAAYRRTSPSSTPFRQCIALIWRPRRVQSARFANARAKSCACARRAARRFSLSGM